MQSDQNYIRYKLQLLKSHAQKLLEEHANHSDDELDDMPRAERRRIMDRCVRAGTNRWRGTHLREGFASPRGALPPPHSSSSGP